MRRVVSSEFHYADGSQSLTLDCGHTLWTSAHARTSAVACPACELGAPAPATLVHSSILARGPEPLGAILGRLGHRAEEDDGECPL